MTVLGRLTSAGVIALNRIDCLYQRILIGVDRTYAPPDTPVESREDVERDQIASVQREELEERKAVRRIEERYLAFKVAEFILGIGGMVGGLYLIAQLHSWYGILVIFIGLTFLFQSEDYHISGEESALASSYP